MNTIKKSTLKAISLAVFSFMLAFFYQNCSKPGLNTSTMGQASLTQQDLKEQQAMLVLTTQCSSCHNTEIKSGGIDILNINEMLALGVIVPGEPSLSLIFTEIQGGRMPPSKSLAQTDVDAIYNWILDSAQPKASIPLPTPNLNPLPLEAKYASIFKNILQPKCLGCHNSGSSNGVSFSSYTATLNTVQKTLPLSSSLYTSVATRKSMPKGNPGSLSLAETKAISDWITAGALNN